MKMSIRRYVTYGGIAAASLVAGAIEGLYDTPCIFKPVLGIVPLASAAINASEAHREEHGSDLGTLEEVEESGFEYVLELGFNAVAGGGLSAICEGVGFGLGKLLSRWSL